MLSVKPSVFGPVRQLKVLLPVVVLNPVDVVDDFGRQERPSKVRRHDTAVFGYVRTLDPTLEIAPAVSYQSALPSWRLLARSTGEHTKAKGCGPFRALAGTVAGRRLAGTPVLPKGPTAFLANTFRDIYGSNSSPGDADAGRLIAAQPTIPGWAMIAAHFLEKLDAALGALVSNRHPNNLTHCALTDIGTFQWQ